jgi:hypothetical protein
MVDVHSERGIGKAKLDLPTPPRGGVTLRLHLRGLEALTVRQAETRVRIEVPSRAGAAPSQTAARRDGAMTIVREGDPLWSSVRIAESRSSHPPLDGGWFEVELPRALLARGPATYELDWIDFHR